MSEYMDIDEYERIHGKCGETMKKLNAKIKQLEEKKTVAWTLGFSAGMKDANKTADIKIKKLEDEIAELEDDIY